MRIELSAMVALLLFAQTASADYVTDYYSIRPLPELGSVVIEQGFFRGKAAHKRAQSRRRTLARKGIYLADNKRVAKHKVRFKLAKRWLAITLTINPPPGRGVGGANHWASLKVAIDNVTKIDTLFGYHAELQELAFKRIVLFEDGIISFEASFNDSDGNTRQLFLDDFGWFANKKQLAKKLDNDALKAAIAAQGKRRAGTTRK